MKSTFQCSSYDPAALSGAFGAGSALAHEDGFILAKAIQHAQDSSQPLRYALHLYETTRNRHYKCLYEQLQRSVDVATERAELQLDFEEALKRKVEAGFADQKWIYEFDVSLRVEEGGEACRSSSALTFGVCGFQAEASWQETLEDE